MSLVARTRLGPYEILGALGSGGMGEVYKARDTRLGRTVAIKVLPEGAALDPERRRRFEQEARAVSALNHPHICVLHDIGLEGDTDYVVMEYLEGQTLAHRLRKGALPIEQALELGAQIADALAKAHRSGIVHRDLKPANVMLTKDGAKLLDFGLAKVRPEPTPAVEGVSGVSTATITTRPGLVMGTVPYMAPELLEGKEADARSDLFAFGCVLYEMLTARRAFGGDSEASVISAIMASEPPSASVVRPLAPPAIDRVIKRCLAKSSEARWQSASDLADELQWIRDTSTSGAALIQPRRRRPRGLLPVLVVAGGLATAVGGAGLMWLLRPSLPSAPLVHTELAARPADEVNSGSLAIRGFRGPGGSATALAWTPDGRALVFVGRKGGVQQLYLRRLDAPEATPLAGTEGAQMPAVSADGRWLAFWAGGAVKRIALEGGPPVEVMTGLTFAPKGLAWSDGGALFVVRWLLARTELWMVPAGGGTPRRVTLAQDDAWVRLPFVLPGERGLLYTVRKRVWTWGDETVVVQPLPAGPPKTLLTDAADARYVPTGHLVFLRRGTLFGAPFDLERLEIRGVAVPLLRTVAQSRSSTHSYDINGAGQFAVSRTGTLAWLDDLAGPSRHSELVAVDRTGRVVPLPIAGGTGAELALEAVHASPDGRHLLVETLGASESSLWIYDLEGGRFRPATHGGEAQWAAWSPHGRLFFNWLRDGRRSLAFVPADTDGSVPPQVLESGPQFIWPASVTPDGRLLAVRDDREIVIVTIENGQTRIEPLHEAHVAESWPALSADGRWLAYGASQSDRTDSQVRPEVYVRGFPGGGPAVLASAGGGIGPVWNPRGRELFYVKPAEPGGKLSMMAVDFAPGSPPIIGTPRRLFEFDPAVLAFNCWPNLCYDVSADGRVFYSVRSVALLPPPPVTHIKLITDWFEELKAKVPAAR